jgi:hypothetical protein
MTTLDTLTQARDLINAAIAELAAPPAPAPAPAKRIIAPADLTYIGSLQTRETLASASGTWLVCSEITRTELTRLI